MDFKKIITDKTQELIDGGEIEKRIESNIQKSINSAIDELFGSYSFKNTIEKKLKEEIDPILSTINLSAYREVVHARAEQIIKSTLDGDLAEKATTHYKALFSINEKEIKLSTIFDLIKKDFYDEDGNYSNYGSYFTVIFKEEDDGSFFRINIYFDKASDTNYDRCNYNFELLKYKEDGEWSISRLKLDYNGEINDKLLMFQPGYLSDFERLLLNTFYKKLPVIVDVCEDDIDTSLFID